MEHEQLLKVGVSILHTLVFEYFYTRMDKQGRILIPKLTLIIMTREENPNIAGRILEVMVEPA